MRAPARATSLYSRQRCALGAGMHAWLNRSQLARLAVGLVLAAERAVLAQLKPVRVVAPVLPRDVVAVLAFLAGQGDLGPDISRSHVARLSLVQSSEARYGGASRAVGLKPQPWGADASPVP